MSRHNQSHQHQPQNPSHAAQASSTASAETPVVTPAVTPTATKSEACTKGTGKCGCTNCQAHIRTRAYAISQARNGGPGNAATDWSQAEKEFTAAAATKA